MTPSSYPAPKHALVPLAQIFVHPDVTAYTAARTPRVALNPAVLAALYLSPMVVVASPNGGYQVVGNHHAFELLRQQPDANRLRVNVLVVPENALPLLLWPAVEQHLLPYVRGDQSDREQRKARKAMRKAGIRIDELDLRKQVATRS